MNHKLKNINKELIYNCKKIRFQIKYKKSDKKKKWLYYKIKKSNNIMHKL